MRVQFIRPHRVYFRSPSCVAIAIAVGDVFRHSTFERLDLSPHLRKHV
jgi:hypothetical protein